MNMNKTTITISATLFALLTMSCTNSANNSTNNNSEPSQQTMQASVTPVQESPQTETATASTLSVDEATSTPTDAETPPAAAAIVQEGQPSATIPNFKFYKVKSGISYEKTDLPKGRKTMFILFDPGCSHCRTEANALGKNYDKFKEVNLLFISMNDPALMATFLETFAKELVGKPNVEVLYDRNQEFIQKIHMPTQFPANYIYSKEGALESHWDGPRDINFMVSAISK